MKVIDAHVHLVQCIAGTGAGGEMRSVGGGRGMYADGSVCQVIPPEWNTEQVTPEKVLEVMDAHEVERAVLLQGGLEVLHLPNVWFDLASLQHNVRPDELPFLVTRQFIHAAIGTVGADRLLFGTDTPSNLCKFRYQDMVDTIAEDKALAEEQKKLILYGNADRVFWN